MTSTDDVAHVLVSVTASLGDPADWFEPTGYRGSLALSAIDSVYSLRARYSNVVRVLARYRAARLAVGADPDADGATQLLDVIASLGGASATAESLFTKHLSPGTKILKAESLERGVAALRATGIETADDLRRSADQAGVRGAWMGQPGLGKASWDYLLMNVGLDGSKADTMVRRFVTRAVGRTELVSPDRAQSALHAAADHLGVSRKLLDHTIWRYESQLALRGSRRPSTA